jgi:hypothetical protein
VERIRKRSPIQSKAGAEQFEHERRTILHAPVRPAKEVPTFSVFADTFCCKQTACVRIRSLDSLCAANQTAVSCHPNAVVDPRCSVLTSRIGVYCCPR